MKEEKELTPVEWLIKELEDLEYDLRLIPNTIKKAKKMEAKKGIINENTSDGYHTFKDLYEFRKAYNVALFNEWASQVKELKSFCMNEHGKIIEETIKIEYKYNVHKSWNHYDGEPCFGGGWFIVVAILPEGQISNHYKAEDWDLFNIPEEPKALFPFDGHTGQDVIERLLKVK